MIKPRGLRSKTPYVHIDKDRGGEAIVLNPIIRERFRKNAQECAEKIERINSSCGEGDPFLVRIPYECGSPTRKDGGVPLPQETYSTLYHVGGVLMALSLLAMSLVIAAHLSRAKAQTPTIQEIVSPMEVFCTGAQKHIKNVLSKTGMFKDAFPLSGEGARQVSKNIFNHLPPADHLIIIRQTNGGAIMVPCVLGKNGPQWDGNKAQRVSVDFVFKNELDNPKTELPEQKSGRAK